MKKGSMALAAGCTLLLIFDSRCAAESALSALKLCFLTVIPGLFPLFVLSGILLPNLRKLPFPRGISRFLGIPEGAEGIFLLGSLGGFPMGARAVGQAVKCGALSRSDGESMLGICNQCGPAFLFGVLPAIFDRPEIPLLCFLLQLESAVLVAHLRPGCRGSVRIRAREAPSLSAAVAGAVRSMATVCAWIVLSSVAAGFLRKYCFSFLPEPLPFFASAWLELAGGCLSLRQLSDPGTRLIFCMGLLCFGGVCVQLQIRALAAEYGLSARSCLRQKLLQSVLGMAFAAGWLKFGWGFLLFPIPAAWFCKKQWKTLRICGIISGIREGYDHAVS